MAKKMGEMKLPITIKSEAQAEKLHKKYMAMKAAAKKKAKPK